MSLQARKRGKFTKQCVCALAHKHEEWNILHTDKYIRMRDMSSDSLQKLCALANFILTSKQKSERNLSFCEGCMDHMSAANVNFQTAFEEYVSPESHDSYDENPMQSGSVECTDQVCFETGQCQTENIIIDITSAVIDLSMLSDTQRQALAYSLAMAERKNLEREVSELSQRYKDIQFLRNFDVEDYLSKQNPVIKSFITGLHGNVTSTCSSYKIARAIEDVIDTTTVGIVQPIHFMESLVLFCTTHSKTGLQILSSETAYPSYYTVQRWLRMLQSGSKAQHPLTSSIYAIDNNQILQKKWGIKVDNKCYSSVTTMVVAFDLQEMDVLRDKKYAPQSWRNHEQFTGENIAKLKDIDQDNDMKDLQYKMSLVPYLSQRMAKVLKEQQYIDGHWIDHVDEKLSSDRTRSNFKICSSCGHENPKTIRKCKACSGSLAQVSANITPSTETETVKEDKERRVTLSQDDQGLKMNTEKIEHTRTEYTHIPIDTDRKCPKVFVLHPSMHNPNSYDAIRNILIDVGKQAGVKKYCSDSENELAVIFCDGVPYNLIWRVCETTFRCDECNILLQSKMECQKHIHDKVTMEFDWVIVLPGPGHIEMNMLKSLVLLLWPVFWKEMVMLFNFTSENALRSARAVSDHHKGWTTLKICRNAIVDELLVPFVRKELDRLKLHDETTDTNEISMSAKDYFKYLDYGSVKNPNYLFMVDVAFELIDAIFLYRAGIRSGRADMAWSARAKFGKVWTGRNHPSYRELNTNDFIQHMMMPLELREFTDKAMSLNLTGVPYTAEGPDFRLEEINKNVQGFLPLSPKNEDWDRVCSNYDTLHELRVQMLEMKGVNKSTGIFKPKATKPAPQEELAVRAMFRKRDYLTNPQEECDHCSISGEPLNSSLVNFCKLAAKNHARFVEDTVAHNKTIHTKPSAVKTNIRQICITQEEVTECAKLEKQTIADLTLMIQSLLAKIEQVDAKKGWGELWSTVVKGRSPKCDYIMFYQELALFLQECEGGDEENINESDDDT